MATFSSIPVAEAVASVVPPRVATQHRYQNYLRSLRPEPTEGAEVEEVAGRLDLDPEDKPITERARLKAAAKAEGMNLYIQRRGSAIVFWPVENPPKPRVQRKYARKPKTSA